MVGAHWEETVRHQAGEDEVLRKVRDGEPLDDAEEHLTIQAMLAIRDLLT